MELDGDGEVAAPATETFRHRGLASHRFRGADDVPHDIVGDHLPEPVVVLPVECLDARADHLGVWVFGQRLTLPRAKSEPPLAAIRIGGVTRVSRDPA